MICLPPGEGEGEDGHIAEQYEKGLGMVLYAKKYFRNFGLIVRLVRDEIIIIIREY